MMMSPLILSMLKNLIQKKMAGQGQQQQLEQGQPMQQPRVLELLQTLRQGGQSPQSGGAPPMLQRHMPPEQLPQQQGKLQQLLQMLQSQQQQGGQQPSNLALLLSLFGGRR